MLKPHYILHVLKWLFIPPVFGLLRTVPAAPLITPKMAQCISPFSVRYSASAGPDIAGEVVAVRPALNLRQIASKGVCGVYVAARRRGNGPDCR